MDYLWLALIGAAAGVLGGLLGVGGAVLMIPALAWLYGAAMDIHQVQAIAYLVVPMLMIPSVCVHVRNRAVWWRVLAWMAPAALAATALGVWLSYLPAFSGDNTRNMRCLLGAFFLYTAGQNVVRLLRPRRKGGVPRERVEAMAWWRKGGVGAVMGLSSGLLSVGGGSIAVPTLQVVLRMPLRNAIATSAGTIACVSWLGAILKNAQLGEHGDWWTSAQVAAVLVPTAMLGSYLGGHLTHRLPTAWVRGVFIALMLVSAWKMLSPW